MDRDTLCVKKGLIDVMKEFAKSRRNLMERALKAFLKINIISDSRIVRDA